MANTKREYLVIRDVATNECRVCPIVAGYKPPDDPAYTWGGPFKSAVAALRALEGKDEKLAKQLYPEGYALK